MWWSFKGIPPAQMNSMVPGTHMGRLLCPQTPLKNKFQANSPKSKKLQVAPATSLWSSLFPLVAVPISPVGPGGRGRSPLDPAHQPEADAGRVGQHARTLQSRGLTRPLTPASTLPPSAAEPSLASIFRPFFQTLILTLNLSSRGVPLEALDATLAPNWSSFSPILGHFGSYMYPFGHHFGPLWRIQKAIRSRTRFCID